MSFSRSSDQVVEFTANGTSTALPFTGPVFVGVSGTFGSGTVTIQRFSSDGVWRDIVSATFTAADDLRIDFAPGAQNVLRAVLTGATSPDLAVVIQGGN
jgi:hypothetical protein